MSGARHCFDRLQGQLRVQSSRKHAWLTWIDVLLLVVQRADDRAVTGLIAGGRGAVHAQRLRLRGELLRSLTSCKCTALPLAQIAPGTRSGAQLSQALHSNFPGRSYLKRRHVANAVSHRH